MKYLDIITGGHPRTNLDLTHLQEGLTESLEAWINGLATDSNNAVQNCILWGLNESFNGNGDRIISEGAVLLGGEICLFPEHNLGNAAFPPGYNIVVKRTTAYHADNPLVYATSASHSPHVIVTGTALWTNAAVQADEMIYTTVALRLKGIVQTNVLDYDSWHTVGAAGEPTLNASYSSGFIKFKQASADMILIAVNGLNLNHWTGLGSLPDIHSSTELLITLPVGYRPTFTTYLTAPMDISVYPQESVGLRIQSNGEVYIGVTADPPSGVSPASFNNKTFNLNTMFNAV